MIFFSTPFKVVVVDDDEDILDEILETIKEYKTYPIQVESFTNPKEALEYITQETVQLLITDLKMPSLMGDQLNLKVQRLCKGTKVVVITGYDSFSTAMTCMMDGANAYVKKPFTSNDVHEAMDRALDNIVYWKKIFKV